MLLRPHDPVDQRPHLASSFPESPQTRPCARAFLLPGSAVLALFCGACTLAFPFEGPSAPPAPGEDLAEESPQLVAESPGLTREDPAEPRRCTTHVAELVGDTVVNPYQDTTFRFGMTPVINTRSGDLVLRGLFQFRVDEPVGLAGAASARLVLFRADADVDSTCGRECPHVPGTISVVSLRTTFDEAEVCYEQARPGQPWSLEAGGADRASEVAQAVVEVETQELSFDLDPSALEILPGGQVVLMTETSDAVFVAWSLQNEDHGPSALLTFDTCERL